ncbi:hypothetical protein NLX86_18885 [Streptomyces sp. A3M-1-3]|uniref:hypothetical protein n=1 Tax=Streptomyces sp. A3M-1-3 TaxID=2962044 RepID=UPI0020B7760B|nr:hypothetical protein [Streptomyces sp. A3M-1-3]MCP3820084.1 hypothetical protein [Streptomyces sp. A3M-1-3]
MTTPLPEPLPEVHPAGQWPVPAHHRPPAVEYRDGIPYHYTIGQPPAPQQIVVQLPEAQGMSPQQREFMMYVVMWLAVAVVLVGCICAVTVIMGGTLMGIIGVVGANAIPIGMTAVGVIIALGWAANRIKGLVKNEKG